MLLLTTFSLVAAAQDKGDSLEGLTEVIQINGKSALRIQGEDGQWIEVRKDVRNGEETLIFVVSRLKKFGLGTMIADDGKLYVSKKEISYVSPQDAAKNFTAERAKLRSAEMKKARQGFYFVYFETGEGKDTDKRFVHAGTIYLSGKRGVENDLVRPAVSFMFRAVNDFDSALAEFQKLTGDVK